MVSNQFEPNQTQKAAILLHKTNDTSTEQDTKVQIDYEPQEENLNPFILMRLKYTWCDRVFYR